MHVSFSHHVDRVLLLILIVQIPKYDANPEEDKSTDMLNLYIQLR